MNWIKYYKFMKSIQCYGARNLCSQKSWLRLNNISKWSINLLRKLFRLKCLTVRLLAIKADAIISSLFITSIVTSWFNRSSPGPKPDESNLCGSPTSRRQMQMVSVALHLLHHVTQCTHPTLCQVHLFLGASCVMHNTFSKPYQQLPRHLSGFLSSKFSNDPLRCQTCTQHLFAVILTNYSTDFPSR